MYSFVLLWVYWGNGFCYGILHSFVHHSWMKVFLSTATIKILILKLETINRLWIANTWIDVVPYSRPNKKYWMFSHISSNRRNMTVIHAVNVSTTGRRVDGHWKLCLTCDTDIANLSVWHCVSVCLSVRDVPVSDENGLTYCHSFFYHMVAQSFYFYQHQISSRNYDGVTPAGVINTGGV